MTISKGTRFWTVVFTNDPTLPPRLAEWVATGPARPDGFIPCHPVANSHAQCGIDGRRAHFTELSAQEALLNRLVLRNYRLAEQIKEAQERLVELRTQEVQR